MPSRLALGVALAAALLCSEPSRAEACTYGGCGELVGLGIGVGAITIATGLVLAYDAAFLARGRWLEPEEAVANIVLGVLAMSGGATLAALNPRDAWLGFGLGGLGFGAITTAIGILSLTLRDDDDGSAPLGLAWAPAPGGGQLVLSGHFW
ncbi:MAG: hypothetical protein RLP09_12710 [Sandaracinaceae bacterium]|nr:hypothetical protein [Myxococcales bacterium]